MTPELLVGALAVIALIAYAVLGGADFGGGIWDLFALGPRRHEQRAAIADAMGPVWEANHVWLIFVIVLLFTAFPSAYGALSTGLFIPFHIVLLGIIARGAAFVFRAYSPRAAGEASSPHAKRWGVIFGVASVVTPVVLGMCLGAVSSGAMRVDAAGVHFTQTPWLAPVSLAIGALALAQCAYLAAVFLTLETDGRLRDDFRTRALLAGTAVVALSAALVPLLRQEAEHLWHGLVGGPGLFALIPGVAAALLSGWALRGRRYRLARAAAVAQIACLVAGWAAAQYPFIVYPDVTLANAAGPQATLLFVLYSTPPGMALLLPSLWYLFRVFKVQKRDAAPGTLRVSRPSA